MSEKIETVPVKQSLGEKINNVVGDFLYGQERRRAPIVKGLLIGGISALPISATVGAVALSAVAAAGLSFILDIRRGGRLKHDMPKAS